MNEFQALDRLNGIEARLLAVTTGDSMMKVFGEIAFNKTAPADVAYLLSEVRRLRDALDSIRHQSEDAVKNGVTALRGVRDIARAALESDGSQ